MAQLVVSIGVYRKSTEFQCDVSGYRTNADRSAEAGAEGRGKNCIEMSVIVGKSFVK